MDFVLENSGTKEQTSYIYIYIYLMDMIHKGYPWYGWLFIYMYIYTYKSLYMIMNG